MLGMLSMERYASKLSEAAMHSVTIVDCTLHGRDGSLSMHSVADLAWYMEHTPVGQHLGKRLAFTCLSSKLPCLNVRVHGGTMCC